VRRGVAWLLALAVLAPFVVMNMGRATGPDTSTDPLPVLYTLGGDFTLNSTLGRALSLSELEGSLVLLNFGYTGCPDVCPTALARMRDAMNLAELEVDDAIQPLFVTLDPEVDSLDRIAPYVAFFDPRFIGLTGAPEAVQAATAPFKVYVEKVFNETSAGVTGPGYSITHSSHIYLLDTSGRVRATFGEGVPVPEIAAAIERLAGESELLAWSDSL
jgi:protein SCO1/2